MKASSRSPRLAFWSFGLCVIYNRRKSLQIEKLSPAQRPIARCMSCSRNIGRGLLQVDRLFQSAKEDVSLIGRKTPAQGYQIISYALLTLEVTDCINQGINSVH